MVAVAGCGGSEAVPPPAPPTANLWVDAASQGSCQYSASPRPFDAASACDSLGEAYYAASDGGTVRVRPGRYPDQAFGGARDPETGRDTPAAHDGAVTFIGDPDRPTEVKLRRLHFGGRRAV